MDVRPKIVSENLPETRPSQNRPLCIKGFQTTKKLHVLEDRPIQHGQRCFSNILGTGFKLCIPSVQSNRESISKSPKGEGNINYNNTSMANSSVVPKIIGNEHSNSHAPAIISKPFNKPQRGNSSTIRKPLLKAIGMEGFREKLATEGISERASDLISNARRAGTNLNYESAWRKFHSWCAEEQVDPIRCDLSSILDYLAGLFESGLGYSYIGLHRSAISAFHEPIEGITVGKHPRVCSLMSGVFNKRPPVPKYNFIWDVETVLKFIKSLPIDDSISDKMLTYKLTALLALTATSRVSEITNLDIDYLAKHPTVYVFTFSKVSKTWKQGQKAPTIDFKVYDSDESLCVCSAI